MKHKQYVLLTALSVVLLGGCMPNTDQSSTDNSLSLAQPTESPQESADTPSESPTAAAPTTEAAQVSESDTYAIVTSKGTITVKLYPEAAPQTVKNFKTKAANDYYKNLTFHRVEDWVIQGGDPLGTGTGGGQMPTELSDVPFKEGSLGVARGGNIKISNDSQFFICTQDCNWLTGGYTNFGEVISGMDVAKKMAIGDKITEIKAVEQ